MIKRIALLLTALGLAVGTLAVATPANAAQPYTEVLTVWNSAHTHNAKVTIKYNLINAGAGYIRPTNLSARYDTDPNFQANKVEVYYEREPDQYSAIAASWQIGGTPDSVDDVSTGFDFTSFAEALSFHDIDGPAWRLRVWGVGSGSIENGPYVDYGLI